jgi:hypothetical protein
MRLVTLNLFQGLHAKIDPVSKFQNTLTAEKSSRNYEILERDVKIELSILAMIYFISCTAEENSYINP